VLIIFKLLQKTNKKKTHNVLGMLVFGSQKIAKCEPYGNVLWCLWFQWM